MDESDEQQKRKKNSKKSFNIPADRKNVNGAFGRRHNIRRNDI